MGLRDHLPPEIIYERELLTCRLQVPSLPGTDKP
jgi:hypothetical protein